ncbi:MAG: ABC transporter permease [Hyphomicrobiaceae bacterium]
MLATALIQTLNGLASASLLFVVALGLTLIFGVTRIVNFAHCSLMMLGAYLGTTLFAALGGGALGFWGGALLAGAAVAILGMLVEIVVLRRLYAAPELLQLIATFGLVLIIKDLVLYLWGPEDILGPRAPGLKGVVTIFGKPLPQYDLVLIGLGPLLLGAVWLLLHRTDWGTRVRAATEDRDMAAALGVNQSVLFTMVLALGAFLAGLAGALALPREPASLGMDLALIADVFVVTVVGGLGSIPGAYLAAVLVGVVKAWCVGLGTANIAGITISFTKLTLVVEFIVMAVVLVFRPWGLLGGEPAHTRVAPAQIMALPRPTHRFWIAALAATATLALLPLVADSFTLVLVGDMAAFALFAASLGLLMGQGGMASFGHAAYFGAGAYASAVLARSGMPFLPALVGGAVLAGGLGLVFGWFCVRLSGVSLAMLSLAFAQIMWAIAFQWDDVTGGSNGLVGIWPPDVLGARWAYFLFVVFVTGAAILATWHLAHTRYGYMLRAARDHRMRAEASGIDVRRMQWLTFAISGALAGLAGAVYVFSKGSLSPDTLSIPRSMDALIMVLLGGVQTLTGPAVGAAIFVGMQDWIARAVPYWQALLGTVVVALTIAFPQGIVGGLGRYVGRERSST